MNQIRTPFQTNTTKQPPRVLAVLPALIPSTIIDVVTPIIDLNRSNDIVARITVENFVKKHDIEWCDLVILCRNIHPNTAGWFLHVLQLKKPYIYDIDDNFFEIPANTPLGKYHREPSRINMLKAYIRLASLVRVYSGPMYERAQKLNSNCVKVTAPVDWRLIQTTPEKKDTQPIKLVYATSRSTDKLADIFKPALVDILEKYRDKIEVHFLGYNPPEFRRYRNVFFQPLVFDYENYLKTFSRAGYDIGLAPLLDDVFHRSKTNNKFREYGASRIAGIYSNVDVYSTCVEHEHTGYLVENTPSAWYKAMSELIDNSALRSNIQEHAYKYVRSHYSQETFSEMWLQHINSVLLFKVAQKKSTKSVIELIAKNSRSRFISKALKNILTLAINIAIKTKEKIKNYVQMYIVLLKIRNKLIHTDKL